VDDILTVPFAPGELRARVSALLRRSYSDAVTFTPVIKIGDLEINILKRTVRAGTSALHLTSLEQSLLYLLAANAGRVVPRHPAHPDDCLVALGLRSLADLPALCPLVIADNHLVLTSVDTTGRRPHCGHIAVAAVRRTSTLTMPSSSSTRSMHSPGR